MKRFLVLTSVVVFFSGCTLTGIAPSSAAANTPAQPEPAKVADTGNHFNDPTPEKEVVGDNVPEAPPVVETPTPAPAEPRRDSDLLRGLELKEKGELRKARLALTAALANRLDEKEEASALVALDEINHKIFLSAAEGGDLQWYTVKSGDTLGEIAKREKSTIEMIKRLNGMARDTIWVGQRLKLTRGEFSLLVRKDRFVMDLMLDGAFIKRYRVGLGVEGCTPTGEFTVRNRISEPSDGSYPYGHAKHRLGSRWLGLKSAEGYRGYGFHGCPASENGAIGTECSSGCVRLSNEDVEEVYDIIPTGTKVTVLAPPVVVRK